jgi:hypothetical protein
VTRASQSPIADTTSESFRVIALLANAQFHNTRLLANRLR